MILKRYEKYLGHLPLNIPVHFVCAECGKPLIHRALENRLDSVECYINPRHTGFRKNLNALQARVVDAQEYTVAKWKELRDISETSQDVKELVKLKNKKDNQDLFGE